MDTTLKSIKIAVLINHPPTARFWTEVRQAFIDSFAKISQDIKLDFYDPIDKQEYPTPQDYDLVILSGGKADASASDPWILKELDFVRTIRLEAPETKILGICWGHQALLRAFGGHVTAVPSGPIAGLVPIGLTEEGKKFFPFAAEKGSYLASQFHVREVARPAEGFIALAENNECFVSTSNTMLSFQAHPEIGAGFSREILLDDDDTYTKGRGREDIEELIERTGDPQDGLDLLRRVLKWIEEKEIVGNS